ncbi:MAG: endo-1,4-beta-xylanase, partial [Anaerolineae bacterium]|nr:endo-1,4-beta-xylanase [Anaerolineae bacterium]
AYTGKTYGAILNYYRVFQSGSADTLTADVATYEAIPRANAELLTFENVSKHAQVFGSLNTSNVYNSTENYEKTDRLATRARAFDSLKSEGGLNWLKWHVLFWYNSQPSQLVNHTWANEAEIFEYMNGYIDRVLDRYSDFKFIDVANEGINSSGTYRSIVFSSKSSDPIAWIEHAFKRAATARSSSNVLLGYNEYSWTSGLPTYPKIPNTISMLQTLLDRGTPIDYVGLQGHLYAIYWSSYQRDLLEQYTQQLESMGLQWGFSEFDVTLCDANGNYYNANTGQYDSGGTKAMAEARKMEIYQWCAQLVGNSSKALHFQTWGFYDGESWKNSFNHPNSDPLPWDDSYNPVTVNGVTIPDAIRDAIGGGVVLDGFTPTAGDTLYPIASYKWRDGVGGTIVTQGTGAPGQHTVNLTG